MRSVAFVLLVACGASSAEIKTAKTSTYIADAHQVLELAAAAAADEHYKIGDESGMALSFATAPKVYSSEGDLESPGAEGFVQMRAGSVMVSFIVQVVQVDPGHVAVSVTPKTFQMISGSPKPRELKPDDPYLPTFVTGRADALALAIYERAKSYAAH